MCVCVCVYMCVCVCGGGGGGAGVQVCAPQQTKPEGAKKINSQNTTSRKALCHNI